MGQIRSVSLYFDMALPDFFQPMKLENWLQMREQEPLYQLLKPFYDNGLIAVQVFWFVSGIIFYKIYVQAICERSVGLSSFLYRRFSRLYPLHFLTLIIVGIGEFIYFKIHGQYFIFSISPIDFFKNLFFVQNWNNQGYTFNGPSWSISVEVLIYIIFFLFALAGFFRNLKSTTIAFLIIVFLKRSGLVLYPDSLNCLYFFIAGSFIICLYDRFILKKRTIDFYFGNDLHVYPVGESEFTDCLLGFKFELTNIVFKFFRCFSTHFSH